MTERTKRDTIADTITALVNDGKIPFLRVRDTWAIADAIMPALGIQETTEPQYDIIETPDGRKIKGQRTYGMIVDRTGKKIIGDITDALANPEEVFRSNDYPSVQGIKLGNRDEDD